jgi:hypothetical protein
MVDRILKKLAKSAARRGIAGEHWAWFVIALAAFVLRRARRADPPLVTSMPLRAGERLLVTLHGDMPAAAASASALAGASRGTVPSGRASRKRP